MRRRKVADAIWRDKRYGLLTGGQIEKILAIFQECWSERESLIELKEDPEKLSKAIEKLMSVPNWTPLYQLSFVQLIQKIAELSGLLGKLEAAASAHDPAAVVISEFESLADEVPTEKELPYAFAMVGNLDAIARYSRSLNDMILACRESGDVRALFDALSIDSYILTMPFFQAALRLGQLSGDGSAAKEIFREIEGPHRKRLEYPQLRWLEYLLRDTGAFQTCTRDELYDLFVVYLGVYDPTVSKKDTKAALFTLLRSWQKQAGIQNPRFGFSAKHD